MVHGLTLGLIGGLIIGLSTVVLLVTSGRIAGISGIVAGLFQPDAGERSWRGLFLVGMVLGGVVMYLIRPEFFGEPLQRSPVVMVTAGLLVGFGTRLGSGCTSGHGICGLSRLSIRSLVAVLSFMAAGIVTVYVTHHVWGWSV